MSEQVSFEAVVEQITFKNESNGWTVMQLRKGTKRFAAVGTVLGVDAGMRVRVSGQWSEHPDYGRQLKVAECEALLPTSTSDIERYLASGAVKGIGGATARIIVEHFGKRTLEILDSDPERLSEVPGIGPKRAALIAESYAQQMGARHALMFLQGCGLSNSMATRVHKLYGLATESIVRTNPYRMIRDIAGIGFGRADAIAARIGIPHEAPARIQSGIIHVLQEASNSGGHVYLPREELASEACRLLNVERELVDVALSELVLSHELVIEDIAGQTAVYAQRMHAAERDVAYRLSQLARDAVSIDAGDVDARISRFEKAQGIKLSPEQRGAVTLAATRGMAVITGGPGTGKTTIIRCILSLMPADASIALCAPTGRAARRMSEATGQDAFTIHRLLEYGGDDQTFGRNRESPLEVDVLVCDEMSMVDILLMRSLLQAVVRGTRLILVGDADQLPSVGPGCVLRDILESGAIPSARLSEIYRQTEDSMIALNAHRINSGELPVLNKKGGDFFMERKDSPAQAVQTIVELARTRLPRFARVDPLSGIQVLSPARKGEVGVYALNSALQGAFNPPRPGVHELVSDGICLREGDKVMHIKNDYQLQWQCGREHGEGVFNGEIGHIVRISPSAREVTVRLEDDRMVVYDDSNINELELAYCISVHKSQGCEFPVVIMPVMPGPRMLMARNLLYTAVTRARSCVVLVGRESVLGGMVQNNYISLRYTALTARICDYAQALGDGQDKRARDAQLEQLEFDMDDFSSEDDAPWA